jgi:uncharacterized YccA/Bax inhibitor family protein
MANPMFNERAFAGAGGSVGSLDGTFATQAQTTLGGGPPTTVGGRTMTVGGTCAAAGLMLVVLSVGAVFGWSRVTTSTETLPTGEVVRSAELTSMAWLWVPMLVGLAIALLTAFRPQLARITALPYALIQGVFVGVISHLYDSQTQGVAVRAVVATIGVSAFMLLLYGLRVLRATPKFTKGVIAATFGVLALYVVSWIASIFTGSNFLGTPTPLNILLSLVIVGIAALNLIIDFDFIERGSASGLPASMEWYGGFGLMVTLIWMYLELLRLLSMLQRN